LGLVEARGIFAQGRHPRARGKPRGVYVRSYTAEGYLPGKKKFTGSEKGFTAGIGAVRKEGPAGDH